MTDRWSTEPARLPPVKYARVTLPALDDGLVHLCTRWHVFDTETQPGKSTNLGAVGTVRDAYDETLCGWGSEKNGRHPRTTDVPTCVACIAAWVARADATLEDP